MLSGEIDKLPLSFDPIEEILNKLRDDVNEAFGFSEFGPRVNQGPCGPFAALFFETWNRLFLLPCQICFLSQADNSDQCYHCFIRLPDGRFFDGGHGVVTEPEIKTLISGYTDPDRVVIEVMEQYDEELFDRRSYGRIKSGTPVGPHCPNFTTERAGALIERGLQELALIDSQNARPGVTGTAN